MDAPVIGHVEPSEGDELAAVVVVVRPQARTHVHEGHAVAGALEQAQTAALLLRGRAVVTLARLSRVYRGLHVWVACVKRLWYVDEAIILTTTTAATGLITQA